MNPMKTGTHTHKNLMFLFQFLSRYQLSLYAYIEHSVLNAEGPCLQG